MFNCKIWICQKAKLTFEIQKLYIELHDYSYKVKSLFCFINCSYLFSINYPLASQRSGDIAWLTSIEQGLMYTFSDGVINLPSILLNTDTGLI